MLVAVASFVAMAAFVKHLREEGMGTAEVMTWRMAPGLPWIWWELRRRGGRILPRRPRLIGLRVLFGGLAMSTNFWAVQSLTLVQHTVLHLAQPVFVATISPLWLRERLRGAAVVALVLALFGALAVIRPDQLWAAVAVAVPLVPGIVGLLSALFSAGAHMSVRMATGMESAPAAMAGGAPPDAPETVVFHFTVFITLITFVIGMVGGDFRTLPGDMGLGEAAWKIAAMAGFGALGQLTMSRAYAHSPAPMVAMVGYTAIPLSMALDVIAWGAPTTGSSLVGAGLMVVAGVLLVKARGANAS